MTCGTTQQGLFFLLCVLKVRKRGAAFSFKGTRFLVDCDASKWTLQISRAQFVLCAKGKINRPTAINLNLGKWRCVCVRAQCLCSIFFFQTASGSFFFLVRTTNAFCFNEPDLWTNPPDRCRPYIFPNHSAGKPVETAASWFSSAPLFPSVAALQLHVILRLIACDSAFYHFDFSEIWLKWTHTEEQNSLVKFTEPSRWMHAYWVIKKEAAHKLARLESFCFSKIKPKRSVEKKLGIMWHHTQWLMLAYRYTFTPNLKASSKVAPVPGFEFLLTSKILLHPCRKQRSRLLLPLTCTFAKLLCIVTFEKRFHTLRCLSVYFVRVLKSWVGGRQSFF